ncbi:hypothetical protein GYA13_04220 [Candidatus Kuenenbacteria bacterium]|nr:hypothetical protein [Candidatus Kuenenbacteria bacterium]
MNIPKRPSGFDKLPAIFRDFIARLEKLAVRGAETLGEITPKISRGNVVRVGDELHFKIIVQLFRGGKFVSYKEVKRILVAGNEELAGRKTNKDGVISFLYKMPADGVRLLDVEVEINDQKGNTIPFREAIEIPGVEKRIANEITVSIPGLPGDTVEELGPDGSFFLNVITAYNGNGMRSDFNVSSQLFDVDAPIFARMDNVTTPQLFTADEGNVVLQLFPKSDEQVFVFSLPGRSKTAKITFKKKVKKADKLTVEIPGMKNGVANELNADGNILIQVATEQKGKGVNDWFSIVASGSFEANGNRSNGPTPIVLHTINGLLGVNLKPLSDEVSFIIRLSDSDQTFSFIYKKKEEEKPEVFRVNIPKAKGGLVDELDEAGCFTAHFATALKNNAGVRSEITISSSGPFEVDGAACDTNNILRLATTDGGDLTKNIKPLSDGQTFFCKVEGTPLGESVTYKKKKEPKPNKLQVLIPGANEKNEVCQKTADGGFQTTLKTFLDDNGIKGTVTIASQTNLSIKDGDTRSTEQTFHTLSVDKLKTVVLYTTRAWQWVAFSIDGCEPKNFLLKNREH